MERCCRECGRRRDAESLERPSSLPFAGAAARSGYIIAIMFQVVLAPSAVASFRALPARTRATVRDAMERHLRHEPARTSKSRIKRLRGLSRPQYRLRVDDIRVFYDLTKTTVEVLAIVSKADAQDWLDAEGTTNQGDRAGESER